MTIERPPLGWPSLAILAAILSALLVVRLPVVLHQPGGQDEEYYAFPGLTIVESGVPRLPHVPQRDPESVFYKADVAFFAEPPLYFYLQAIFYAVFPATYGTARLASLLAGMAAVVLVYLLARRWYGDEVIALSSAGLYSLLRMFYFPAMTARPDILCTALGLGAVYAFDRWRAEKRAGWFMTSGVLLGLGGLTHPFALVYAIQLAAWSAWSERRWRRGVVPLALAGIAMITCALWVPLIVAYPEEFRMQFGNNILHPAGPGLMARLVWPFPALVHHAELLWERAAPVQFLLLSAGLIASLWRDGLRRDARRRPVLLALSSIYLISTLVGIHPGHGYWSYAAAYLVMCLASMAVRGWRQVAGAHTWLSLPAGSLLVLLMVPGLGLRATGTYLTHWGEEDYDARRFARRLIDQLPTHDRYTVGREYVLDFYAAGRTTLMGTVHPLYIQAQNYPYDALVVGREELAARLPEIMQGRLLRVFGRIDDPFACYAAVYVHTPGSNPTTDPTSPSAADADGG
ncbi:MAG: glycosyltransferase family 39 protein [Planctomycetaceae bacterium]|nr:glycosyltransferase family 39 protein [Planctomycetaceae bacterium]